MKSYKTLFSIALVALGTFAFAACEKEEPLKPAKWESYNPSVTTAEIHVAMGSVGQSLCSGNYKTSLKVTGQIAANHSSYYSARTFAFSTDSRDVAVLYPPCTDFMIDAFELVPSPTGGAPTQGQEILLNFDDKCELKVHPGTYASIRITGRTVWAGKDPASLGLTWPAGQDKVLKELDIDCY